MGRSSVYRHTVRPRLVVVPAGTPLATPAHPAGTSSANVNVALSLGWSLQGKTVCMAAGWPASTVPSGVDTRAAPPWSTVAPATGLAEKPFMFTVNVAL